MHAKKTNKTKVLAVVLALVLVIGCTAGATLAWLTDRTGDVVNTFTVGNIKIDLKEHELKTDGTLDMGKEVTENANYKMVPGNVLPKDPFVTVKANSEACWLFVKIQKSANFDTYMESATASGWTLLTGDGIEAGVYYREVNASTEDQPFSVLANDQVKVRDTVTKKMMDDITNGIESAPTITFTAYAVQKDNVADAATAWGYAKNTPAPTPTPTLAP